MARGNGKIFYDAPNRGSKRIVLSSTTRQRPTIPHPRTCRQRLPHAPRLHRRMVWMAGGSDAAEELAGNGNANRDPGRKETFVKVRAEIVVEKKGIKSQPLSGDERVKSYEAGSRDKSSASLTVREKSYGQRIPVPSSEWEFASCAKDSRTSREIIKPSSKDLYLRSGFKPGHIYELIYPAKNPLVLGLGFAVVRDLVSFLRYQSKRRRSQSQPIGGRQ